MLTLEKPSCPPSAHLLFQRRDGGLQESEVKDPGSYSCCPWSVDMWVFFIGNSLGIPCKSCMSHILCHMVLRSWINSHLDCSWSVLCKVLERYVVWTFLEWLWQFEVWSRTNLCTSAPTLQILVVWFLSGYSPRFSFPSCYTWWSSYFFFFALRSLWN